ncbi:MAG: DUF4091 domain-containing protein [Bifidobacteriaceae bacterium]|jgi:hypothetical protein|nr:DUF4091 domain-containing protein [Bifidobacteriaceae bacterium]
MYNYLGWAFSSSSYSIQLARNEREGLQAFVWEKTDGVTHNVRLEVSDFTGPGGAKLTPTVYREAYMLAQGGWFSATDAGMGYFADALIPYDGEYQTLDAVNSLVWYIELLTAKDSVPGDYTATVTLIEEGSTTPLRTGTISAHVWDFALPEGHYATTAFGNFNEASGYWMTDSILYASGTENPLSAEDPTEAKAIIKAWYDLLLDHGVSGYELPYGLIDDDPRALAEYIYDPRVTSFSIPYNKHQPWAHATETQAYYDIISQHPDMFDKAFFYPEDEPAANAQYAAWIDDAISYITPMWPDPHIVVPFGAWATEPGDNTVEDYVEMLRGRADILCPIAGTWQVDYATLSAAAAEWKQNGGKVWLYPGGFPYASLDVFFWNGINPGLDRRALLWQAYKLGVEGILYWQTADWEAYGTDANAWDPWLEGQNQVQLNGNAQLVYPAASLGLDSTDLIASLRLKQFTDGLEDYDYLTLAEDILGEAFVEPLLNSMLVMSDDNPGSIVNAGIQYRPGNWTGQLDATRKAIGDALEAAQWDYTCGEWTEYLAPDATHEGLELRTCNGGAQESRRTPYVQDFTLRLTQPAATGQTTVGGTLDCTTTVNPPDAEVYYQWFRGSKAVTAKETTSTYTVKAADAGQDMVCKVYAYGYDGAELVKYSNHLVITQPLAFTSLTVTGTPKVGSTLTGTAVYTPADATVTYQWYRETSAIGGAKAATYVPVAADAGHDLVLKVSVTVTGEGTITKYSNHVQVAPILTMTQPVIAADPATGALVATVAVTPADATVTYQWFLDAKLVGTGSQYQPTQAGDAVCKVTATKAGYDPVVKYSNHIAVLIPVVIRY